MGVAREIAQDLFRPRERLLGVDHPLSPAQRRQEAFEGPFVGERCMLAEEGEAVLRVSLGQHGQEPPAEQAREHLDGNEEARPRRDPAPAIRRQSARRHDHVHVRMVRESGAPDAMGERR
jgi:hypothetical protein